MTSLDERWNLKYMPLNPFIPAVRYGNTIGFDESQTGVLTVTTTGTTAVSVFPTTSNFPITITGVYLNALDVTAGNITVENPAGTVVTTIAKGTTAGVLVGATSLANTSVLAATNLIVKSSSAGNAVVYISYNRV